MVVATNAPTTIYDRMKLAAIQALDYFGQFEDPAFLLVVAARQYDEKEQKVVTVAQSIPSDPRTESWLLDRAHFEWATRNGVGGSEDEDE